MAPTCTDLPRLPLPRTPRQIWLHLAPEQKTQAIQLMARLAFNLLLAQPDSTAKDDAFRDSTPQNPA